MRFQAGPLASRRSKKCLVRLLRRRLAATDSPLDAGARLTDCLLLFRTNNWARFGVLLALAVLAGIAGTDLEGAASVRVAWDPNPEHNIAGYRIYYGPEPRAWTNVIDTGNQTTGTVTNLAHATTYFFYVTAYNTFQLESDPSDLLTHTTRPFTPLALALEPHLIVLAPSQVTLRPTLTGDRLPDTELTVAWQQSGGPEWLTIAGLRTLTPTLQVRVPGSYSLIVTVTEGTSVLQKSTWVRALDASAPSAGPEPLTLSYVHVPPDGLLLTWNSEPGAAYLIGRRVDLNDRYWVGETDTTIPSAGSLTDFVIGQESLDQIKHSFFTVFRAP